MIELNILKLYEHLAELNEAKTDVDNFINKFGQDTYELFKKSTQRLKNKGISTDLTYHVKHTAKKDLDAILINLQNRAITKDGNLTEIDGDYEYLGTDKGYKVYKINDVTASINLGSDTGWCISGRYGHYGEKNYTPSKTEAEKHWKDYTKQGAQFYFFISDKDKIALALYPKTLVPKKIIDNTYIERTNCEIYTEQDELDYRLFSSLPIDLVDEDELVIFESQPLENGLYIKDNVVLDCDKSLENVVIPYGVRSINIGAFGNCSNLTNITIPNSVTSIYKEAFQNCESLTSITIPDSVTYIGFDAFSSCYSLTSVTIGKNVRSINIGMFSFCESLTNITIPDNVTTIAAEAFRGCESLTSVTIGKNVRSICEKAFNGCSSLNNLIIPDSVTSIDNMAFLGCSSLTSITIPDSVTSIGEHAFYNCDSLASVTIGNSVTSIGRWAFFNCDSLTSITIGRNVRSIGDNAFKGCHSLTNIIVDKNNPNYKVVDGHLYDKDDEMIV